MTPLCIIALCVATIGPFLVVIMAMLIMAGRLDDQEHQAEMRRAFEETWGKR